MFYGLFFMRVKHVKKKSNLIESQKISVSISFFFPNMKNGKVTKKWTPTFLYNFGKNITLMSSDILLQYISKFSAIQDCSGPLSRTANPKILRWVMTCIFFHFFPLFLQIGQCQWMKRCFHDIWPDPWTPVCFVGETKRKILRGCFFKRL